MFAFLNGNIRPRNLGILMVVGGPGGSGSSTIAKHLGKHFGLRRYYGGARMRQIARDRGYNSLADFYETDYFLKNSVEIDSDIDKYLVQVSYQPDVLIESKTFAALSHVRGIPCTVKIWIDADFNVKVKRTMLSRGGYSNPEDIDENSPEYKEAYENLKTRYQMDEQRYEKLYSIDYPGAELYNDIVVDSTKLDVASTFNLILNKIKDGGFIS
ncbi:hypothetical protein GF357_00735 [Candidatus Dojkabacteria bacterium]|nr:hypothetical protein [Candidatus Dojkabacteria bacterium]